MGKVKVVFDLVFFAGWNIETSLPNWMKKKRMNLKAITTPQVLELNEREDERNEEKRGKNYLEAYCLF